MNVIFIELLTILQLITIPNNNIKPQAIKRLIKFLKIGYLYARLSKVQLIIFVFDPSALKIIHCGP